MSKEPYRRPVRLKPDELPDPDPEEMAQLTKEVEELGAYLPQRPPDPPPIDYESFDLNAKTLSGLFPRADRPASEGDANRVTLTFTITPETDMKWRDFLHTFTGTRPKRGGGISSAMVELSMLTTMAIMADFHPRAVGYLLSEVSNSDETRARMVKSLGVLSGQLKRDKKPPR